MAEIRTRFGVLAPGMETWALGDWCNKAASYGEKYAQAIAVTGQSLSNLQVAAYVARAFDVSRRRENLTWSHHRLWIEAVLHGERARAEEFFARSKDGAGLPIGSPILALRGWLARTAASPRKPAQGMYDAIVIKAWNAYARGRPVRVLSFRPGEETFPVPEWTRGA